MDFNMEEMEKVEAAVEQLSQLGMNIRLVKHDNGEVELECAEVGAIDFDDIDIEGMSKEGLVELREQLQDWLDDLEDEDVERLSPEERGALENEMDDIENLIDEIDDILDDE